MREATVRLDAISANVATMAAVAGGVPVMVVVKADGYGHGAVPSARAALAGGAQWLGVADIDEAMALRAAGIDAPILAWLHDPAADLSAAIAAGVDIGVNYLDQLDRVAATGDGATVQLKVDSGLGRNGAGPREWDSLFAAAAAHERAGRIRVRGIWSHLANAGPVADAAQLELFHAALEAATAAGLEPELVHLAASEAVALVSAARFGLVRVGLAAYGLPAWAEGAAPAVELVPAMELSASIVSVKRVPAGSGVSYGFDYRTTRETTLALVPLGYADGVPRHASGTGPVMINGVQHRVAGRVAMDQFVVDVGDNPVRLGDRAVLFGDPATGAPSAVDWAAAAGTISYEIVTRIGPRVHRRYLR